MSASPAPAMHQTTYPPGQDDHAAHEWHIVARDVRPGDYLPPQPALHGTRFQHDGFTVGNDGRDVLVGIAVVPGRMLIFGPTGTLDSVATDTQLTVRRNS